MSRPEDLKHPIQPLYKDNNGIVRFKKNMIVDFLIENGGFTLSQLRYMPFSNEDWQQVAQLQGHSLDHYSELPYVTNDAWNIADKMYQTGMSEDQATIAHLTESLAEAREKILAPLAALFGTDEEYIRSALNDK